MGAQLKAIPQSVDKAGIDKLCGCVKAGVSLRLKIAVHQSALINFLFCF